MTSIMCIALLRAYDKSKHWYVRPADMVNQVNDVGLHLGLAQNHAKIFYVGVWGAHAPVPPLESALV